MGEGKSQIESLDASKKCSVFVLKFMIGSQRESGDHNSALWLPEGPAMGVIWTAVGVGVPWGVADNTGVGLKVSVGVGVAGRRVAVAVTAGERTGVGATEVGPGPPETQETRMSARENEENLNFLTIDLFSRRHRKRTGSGFKKCPVDE